MTTERNSRNDIFQTWSEAQRTWIRLWDDSLAGFPKGGDNIYNQWLNMPQEMFGQSWKEVPWGIGAQTFERALSGAQVYNKLYEFWIYAAKILSRAPLEGKGVPETYLEFCDFWGKCYLDGG